VTVGFITETEIGIRVEKLHVRWIWLTCKPSRLQILYNFRMRKALAYIGDYILQELKMNRVPAIILLLPEIYNNKTWLQTAKVMFSQFPIHRAGNNNTIGERIINEYGI